MGKFEVFCPTCQTIFSGYTLSCQCNSLLQTRYFRSLEPRALQGLWRFLDWLPCEKPLDTKAGSITYTSQNLGRELGLDNLIIGFTGYWPERHAYNLTGSFKDLEASPTVARAKENGVSALTIASAGNTARAFAHMANVTDFEVYLIVPETSMSMLWTPEVPTKRVHLITVKSDYYKAIEVTGSFCKIKNIFPEGGAKNVARRDGMGTVMLDAALTIKRLPDHYFQAIGSGTGAIGCWEMARRLQAHGWKGQPKLHLSQNKPFIPIYHAWKAGRRQILPEDMPQAEKSINQLHAVVLSNRNPPYSISGGVYDALSDTQGEMYAVTNSEAKQAGNLFESMEGIDLVPAAEVVVASLIQAVEEGQVDKTDWILLNVTGGGVKRIGEDFGYHEITPEISIDDPDCDLEEFFS
jgi:cysteate synthase